MKGRPEKLFCRKSVDSSAGIAFRGRRTLMNFSQTNTHLRDD
jgi:hypothetical protein